MIDDESTPNEQPSPTPSAQPSDVRYIQDPLFAPPRNEMTHLTDEEYEQLKAQLGDVGTEHDKKYAGGASREELMERLGMTASGRTVSVRLLPEAMSRVDIDVRGTPIWAELSAIHYLHRELSRAGAATSLDAALFRILDPIMQGGESNPNAIGEAFVGTRRSRGRPDRMTAFSKAMQLVQHGSEDQRQAIIDDMKRRLAIAAGQPDPVTIAKQLILSDMPVKPGEKYGDED